MNINGQHYQSIWYDPKQDQVSIIDQTRLPHEFKTLTLNNLQDACHAILSMQVRGAPLIGVTAAYGLYLALRDDPDATADALAQLLATRPTAVNLQWALQRMQTALEGVATERLVPKALEIAQLLEKEDIAICEAIGEQGTKVLTELWQRKVDNSGALNVLTHCNAGALAAVDWGTALAVIYKTAATGIPIHVWVDETRPRNQGAALTCWELAQQGIPHTLIVDSAGGHLMQRGEVDVCLVGSDRTAINGDVCNKIGTYLKALAAKDNNIPFYVALPISSIDFSLSEGVDQMPIEQRSHAEVTHVTGVDESNRLKTVRVTPVGVAISNYGFDVTPAHLVSGLITERGVFAASKEELEPLRD